MSESGDEDIEHLRSVGKKALWLSNKMEQERAQAKAQPRGGEFFEVGQPYTVIFEIDWYEDGAVVTRKHRGTVLAVDGHLVRFRDGFVLNTLSRTFARASHGYEW